MERRFENIESDAKKVLNGRQVPFEWSWGDHPNSGEEYEFWKVLFPEGTEMADDDFPAAGCRPQRRWFRLPTGEMFFEDCSTGWGILEVSKKELPALECLDRAKKEKWVKDNPFATWHLV